MKNYKLFTLLIVLLCATAAWAQSQPWTGSGTSEDPYKITSKADWDALATAVNDGNTFAGKYFLLTEDLEYSKEDLITTMIGSDESSHYFSGTFDGGGHYIYVSYVVQESYIAPFRYVKNATIKNLHVEGAYVASARFAAGIISVANGTTTIENCRVSISLINDYSGGDTTHGGLVAINRNGTLNITGCIFDGGITSSGTYHSYAGFVGWNETNNGSLVNITNCLFAPNLVTIDGTEGVKTFCRSREVDGYVTLSNCYYTTVLVEPQGKQAYNVTAREGVTMTKAGEPTTYDVSGLSFYGENKGFVYDGKIRGGNGDQVALNLTGFPYFQTSSGTLTGNANPYTLTMVAADAEIAGKSATTVVTTEAELLAAITDGANIQLGNSIDLTQEVVIDGNKIVIINLNGKTLNRGRSSAADDGHVFKIGSDSRLTINDSSGDNSGVIKGGYSTNGGAIDNGGMLIFNGGTITQNNASDKGAGIWNRSGGTLVINGGAITGNTAANNGGGIFNEGTLHMQGAISVTGNTRSSDNRAANLYLKSGKIKLTAALTDSHIGVDMPNSGVITTDFSVMHGETDPATIFTSDYSFVKVKPYQGEASLKYYYLDHHWDSENNTLVEEEKYFAPGTVQDFSNSGLTLHDGNYVVRQSETIDNLQIAGDVKLLLCDGATLTVNRNIFIMSIGNNAHFLNFYTQTAGSTGKVITKGEVGQYTDYVGPGIGDPNNTGSTINIHGGVFDVKGCDYGAGIGLSGEDDNVKRSETTINIYGGTITAKGGEGAAGIGGGKTNPYYGNINIYGGTINATGGASPGGAGIGGGDKSKDGTLHIYGGFVTAHGGHEAAGIGCGQDASSSGSGKIYISGGSVIAYGGNYAAGIGGGDDVSGYSVEISGGNVKAYGGIDAAGIGGGEDGKGGTINISGGYVEAYGGSDYGAGIGGGEDGDGGDVTITGGTVIAEAGTNASGYRAIGPGKGSNNYGKLTISDEQMVRETASSTPFTASERKNGCWYHAKARVEACTHASVTYTASGATTDDTHTKHCKYCTTHFPAEQHTFNSNNVCTVCGIDLQSSTVNIYLPKEEGTDALDGKTYTLAATYMMVFGTEFTLPHCPVFVPGLEFVGWEVGTVPEDSYVSGNEYVSPYTTTGGTIKKPGDSYTIQGNVSFVARYEKLHITLKNGDSNGEILSQFDGRTVSSITLFDRNLYANENWNTLCLPFDVPDINSTCLVGATVKTLKTTSFSNGTLTMNFGDDQTSIVAGEPYIVKWKPDYVISSKVQWESFALSVKEGTSYEGKLIHLTADIGDNDHRVTSMVGTSEHPFKGTLDGKGHTIYVGIEYSSADLVAPFRYVDGATFRNLIITGIVENKNHIQTGGLIGSSRGEVNISNCLSNVSVRDNDTSVELAKNGGFISTVYAGSVYFTNCAFTGDLYTSTNARCWSGFVGWREDTTIPLSFKNCLYNPRTTSNTNRYNSTFSGNGSDNNTYDNCYYRKNSYNNQGTYCDATMSEQVTLLGNKWEVHNPFLTYNVDKAVPKMIAGIIDPEFHGVTIRNITGDVATDYADFVGCYSPVHIDGEDKSILYLGAENKLYYPNAAMTINAFRSYFRLKGITAGDVTNARLFFGDDTTGIVGLDNLTNSRLNNSVYDLQGRKVSPLTSHPSPLKKGVYIYNGRKIVLK